MNNRKERKEQTGYVRERKNKIKTEKAKKLKVTKDPRLAMKRQGKEESIVGHKGEDNEAGFTVKL